NTPWARPWSSTIGAHGRIREFMTAHICCKFSSTRQESTGVVIIAPALKLKASTPAVASTLMTWLLEITPTAIPSLSHTTTRGVFRFARILAASKSDASRLSTASRFRAASRMCLTRIIRIVPHLSPVDGSPPRSGAAEREASLAFTAVPSLGSPLTYVLLAILLPVLPPADALVVIRTAQPPVPFAQLLARVPCPTSPPRLRSRSIGPRARWADAHCPMGLLLILASQ